MVLLFWYRLTQAVLEKRSLMGVVKCMVNARMYDQCGMSKDDPLIPFISLNQFRIVRNKMSSAVLT